MAAEPSDTTWTVPAMTALAERFLAGQHWVSRVHGVTPVFAIAGTLGVFRCAVIPSQPDADVMVWVVVGDLRPAWVLHEPGDSWQDALAGYVDDMERWVAAARAGKPLSDVIPVDVARTGEYLDEFAARLEFIRTRLVDVDPRTVASDV